MFTLRRLQSQPGKLVRIQGLQVASIATATATEEASTERQRRRRFKTRRPKISLEHPREWKRPLALGVLPAFDEALKFIKSDSESLKLEMREIRASLEAAKDSPERDAATINDLEERLNYLETQSEINFPQVQWKCANGMADMSRAVDRHLVEQRWRKEGALDLLMERLHQMHVVPDIVPDLHPSFDLRISFPEHGGTDSSAKAKYKFVEPGVYLLPEQTMNPPKLHKDVFHVDERLYTLVMIDPDVPDEMNSTFQSFLHWLQPNISLSASSPSLISNVNTHTQYIPPHPQKGTPYHRYSLLMLPQKSHINVPAIPLEKRLGFSLREFMTKYHIDPATGGGAHMWRGEWNAAVSRIYQDIFKTEEVVFGKLPKPDRYIGVRGKNRYFL